MEKKFSKILVEKKSVFLEYFFYKCEVRKSENIEDAPIRLKNFQNVAKNDSRRFVRRVFGILDIG